MTRLRASFAWARIPILNGIFILTPSAARFVFVPSTHRKKKRKKKRKGFDGWKLHQDPRGAVDDYRV